VGTATADPRPFFLSISRMITPVKQQLAAVRMLFDWLITGQIMPVNPASAVRGPKHVVKTGKTPVLEGQEWRKLIDAIPTDTVRDLRDRALIATLTRLASARTRKDFCSVLREATAEPHSPISP
jgi:integrase